MNGSHSLPGISQAVRVAGAPSESLLKYSAKYCPVKHGPAEIGNTTALDTRPSLLRTLIDADPSAATSDAGMLAWSCVALTNVVGRATPLTSSVEPEAKLPPSAVSVKAGPPPTAPAGVSFVRSGPVGPSRRSSAASTWISGLVTVPPDLVAVTGLPVACSAVRMSSTEAPGIACLS